MSKILSLLFFSTTIFATGIKYDATHTFLLKKDKVALIEYEKRDKSQKSIISFRWTLFTNNQLVLLVKKDNFPSQYILHKRYKLNRIKIYLRDDYKEIYNRSYLVLEFKDFSKKEATILAKIIDPKREFRFKFTDPKK
jgi:hypothetical protein